MEIWHEQDNFWEKWAPILFHKQHQEKTQEEVTNIISLLKIIPEAAVLDLCCGPRWNLLVEVGINMGINLDKTLRARKVGHELIGM